MQATYQSIDYSSRTGLSKSFQIYLFKQPRDK